MAVDFENLEPPRMEGLDAQLAAVSISDLLLFSYKLLSNSNCFINILQKKKYTSKNEPEQNGKILLHIYICKRALSSPIFNVLSGPLDLTNFAMV